MQIKNYNEIPPHTHQDGYYQKTKKPQKASMDKDVEELETLFTVGRDVRCKAVVETVQ